MSGGIRVALFSTTCAAALWLAVGGAAAQTAPAPVVVRPGITLPPGFVVLNPGSRLQIVRPPSGFDQGPGRAHTNIELLIPRGGYPAVVPNTSGPPVGGELNQTPASLACDYGLVTATNGCNPNLVTTNPSGGSKAIAIVDAYDLATATSDLATFDTQFGYGTANFTKIYGTGNPSVCANGSTVPQTSSGWNGEEDLDIEYAHAMAPSAHLYLVEANSSSFTDLFNAEQVAAACVAAAGGGQVSNSWGSEEFSKETTYDKYFKAANIVYFASTGDDTYPGWPATSPDVVAVGGTTLASNANTGQYLGQSSWYPNPDLFALSSGFYKLGEGTGSSAYEAIPAYQKGVKKVVGSKRGIPDVVAVADPYTGVWIYSPAEFFGWGVIGGTSVASPLVAGIANQSGDFFASTDVFLTDLYTAGTGKTLTQFAKMDSGNCGVPTSPKDKAPFKATYETWGATIGPQYQEALNDGLPYNECGGWGSPASKTTLTP
jgi:hypothetical protein